MVKQEEKQEEYFNATGWLWALQIWLIVLTILVCIFWVLLKKTKTQHGTLAYWDNQFHRYHNEEFGWECYDDQFYEIIGYRNIKHRLCKLENGEHDLLFRFKYWPKGYKFDCGKCGYVDYKKPEDLTCSEREAIKTLGLD